jgi:hypothetical protein
MYETPLVSVIVLTYNQEATIGQTLDTILFQQGDFRRYDFRFDRGFLHLFAVLLGLCGMAFGITFFIADHLWCGLAVGGVLAVTGVVCWRELNKRMDIEELIRNKFLTR